MINESNSMQPPTKKAKFTNQSSPEIDELMYAAREGDLIKVQSILKRGTVTIHTQGPLNLTALAAAVPSGNVKLVQFLIDQGSDVNVNVAETTPLSRAINTQDVEMVQLLLDAGANPNFRGKGQKPLIHLAIIQGKPEIVTLLVKHGASLKVKNNWGETPLAYAQRLVEEGNETIKPILDFLTKWLLENQKKYVKSWQEKIKY